MTKSDATSATKVSQCCTLSNQRQGQGHINSSRHAVIILASGLSLRLGRSKQLLSKDGVPLIHYMIQLALATQPRAVIVVIPNNNPAIINAIAELIVEEPRIHTVVNPEPETGMAHSLFLGIEALANTKSTLDSTFVNRVLIMGIDQVLLDEQHLTSLLAGIHIVLASGYRHLDEKRLNEPYLNESRTNGAASINSSKEHIVGLPIAIDCERLKQWQSALIGDKGLRHLIRALPSHQISTLINDQLSYDIDTPEQYAYAKQQGWLD